MNQPDMSLLAIQPGAIGDFVLSLPALAALRQTLGADGQEIWAERANLPLVEHPAYATSVRALADTGIDSYPLPARTLRAMCNFDAVVSWRGANLPELRQSVQAAHARAFFFPQFPPQGEAIHLCDFRRAQIGELLEGPAGKAANESAGGPPRIFLQPGDLEFAQDYLRGGPAVVLHPGASGASKQWPAAEFAALGKRLAERYGARVMLTEGPLDAAAVRAVVDMLAGAGVGAERVAIPHLRRLAAVLAQAAVFVGNDTGIAHLAAAAGAPVLAIFVSTDPRIWAPRGPRVKVLVRPPVEEAIRAAEQMTAGSWQ